MLTPKQRIRITTILDSTIGVGTTMKNDERAHHCPFCSHHKKKLQVNLETQKWHCWVCNAKGQTIGSLLRKSNAPSNVFPKIPVTISAAANTAITANDANPTIDFSL